MATSTAFFPYQDIGHEPGLGLLQQIQKIVGVYKLSHKTGSIQKDQRDSGEIVPLGKKYLCQICGYGRASGLIRL
jgi:hypothetical protein